MTANGPLEVVAGHSRQMTGSDAGKFATVSREYQRFIRLFARTFLPVRAVVVIDQLVKLRYCTELQLVPILRAHPKHLRRLLWQLRDRGLVRSETRVYKRVFMPRGPGAAPITRYKRLLYWYLDYQNAVNMTLYKIHRMQAVVEERLRAAESGTAGTDGADGSYVCERCKRAYSALDIPTVLQERSGELRCIQLIQRDVRCSGLVREVDCSDELSSIRQLQHALDAEMRPLAEAASACLLTETPRHPLDGMDEDQVGAIIAAQQVDSSNCLGARRTESERTAEYFVGPHELDIEVEVSGLNAPTPGAEETAQPVQKETDGSVTKAKQPAWFSDSPIRFVDQGETRSSIDRADMAPVELATEDAEVDEYADVDFEEASYPEPDSGWNDDLDQADSNEPDWHSIAEPEEMNNTKGELVWESDGSLEAPDTLNPGTALCLVAGEPVPLEAITGSHTERMSVAEYQQYYALLQKKQRK